MDGHASADTWIADDSLPERGGERVAFPIELGPIMSWSADKQGNIIGLDQRTGRPIVPSGHDTRAALVAPEDRARVRADWDRAIAQGHSFDYELRLLGDDGQYRWHRICAAPRLDRNGRLLGWHGMTENVHDRKLANDAILWAAEHDDLTGLFNRGAFRDRLRQAFDRAAQDSNEVTLALVNLDRFKGLNDRFGHDVGDELLQQVSRRLERALPEASAIGRVSGDEFAILLEGADRADIDRTVAAIQSTCNAALRVQAHSCRTSASVGIAVYPRDAENMAALYKCAELALREAKRGLGVVHNFDGSMRDRHQVRMSTLAVMRSALARQRVHPFYQPKVDLLTGRIAGFEALLRWEHERHGIQSASSIASAFEDAELATALDGYIFDRIAEDIAEWKGAGIPFGRIAINASAVRFQRGVQRELLDRIERSGLSPLDFELEVTEDILIGRELPAIAADLQGLRDAGMKVALDDFGTGFASLIHLKHFQIDVLKIDCSFVQNLNDPTNAAIVAAIVTLGNRLAITTVAEGIETLEQANRLYRKGCNLGQGFFFSQAIPAADVPRLLSSPTPLWLPGERRSGNDRREIASP